MIKINKGASNTVALTLYEKTTIAAADVHYLFVFQNATDNRKYYCIPADTSNFISRYNQFAITETSSPDPLVGEVELSLTGFYHYFIYEQESTTNLDPTGLTLVESGICKVIDAIAADTVYQSDPIQYTVYQQ